MPANPGEAAPVVAHVNYSFFHSTQSFIHFTMSRLRRVRPICLTRAPETPVIRHEIRGMPDGDFYVYGADRNRRLAGRLMWNTGVALRRRLTELPSWLSGPLLRGLQNTIVPRVRSDADPVRFMDWSAQILRHRNATIIHAYFGAVGWRMLAARRTLGIPLVTTLLGDDLAPTLSPWWSWWIRTDGSTRVDWPARLAELLRDSDLVLVEGPHMQRRAIEQGCPASRIGIQRMAVPVAQIPFRVRGMRRDGKATILFAGRFCEQKGLLYALEAVRELREQREDFVLRLVGDDTMTDGAYAARVHDYIRRHRLGGCVEPVGFLNHAEYVAELDRADIFLHPSIVTDEGVSEGGAPTTILEAQAAGLPIVSTEHCDIPYVTVPGRSAILVPERDARALARVLGTLLDEPKTWEGFGRAGREHVERFHDADKEAPLLEDRYFALLDQARGQ